MCCRVYITVLTAFAISPAVSSAIRNLTSISTCRTSEFTCLDGTCIGADAVCDTYRDCPDDSDEASCYSNTNSNLTEATVSQERYKRQTSCGLGQWPCADGTCIDFDGKCDGKIDCPDRSDETHALCRTMRCQRNWFRCTYGACVDSTAPCNNITDCADESDELLSRCRNETRRDNDNFRCQDGNTISLFDLCDGVPNCSDGSDETIRECGDKLCQRHLFQCAYGACVDQNANCNRIMECADGSDESDELCKGILPPKTTTRLPTGKCNLPSYPEHGTYVVLNAPSATPGQTLEFAELNITCNQGYGVVGAAEPLCLDGEWKIPMQKCVAFCRLDPDVSVKYLCPGSRSCSQAEPSGTIVKAKCNTPNYGSSDHRLMICQSDGKWNYIKICKPECGLVTPNAEGLVFGGEVARRGELPWHVAVYEKPNQSHNDYMQICGGSIVSNKIVITAAHCFKLPVASANYAVATAKRFRKWDDENDEDVQKSEIKSINHTHYYDGVSTNYQHDIAILILETQFVYHTYVRPVCLDFETNFNRQQLEAGNFGKVAGWGKTGRNETESLILKVVKLPIVSIEECKRLTPETFRESITGDKICAGYTNDTAAVCKGDSGGGLSFPAIDRDKTRYYLRGIVSTGPQSKDACNTDTVTTFTEVYTHKDYINEFL